MTGSGVQRANRCGGLGRGAGPGCGPQGAGRAGARAPEFAEKQGASGEGGPKFYLSKRDASVELEVGSLREEAVGQWRGCWSRVALHWKVGPGRVGSGARW